MGGRRLPRPKHNIKELAYYIKNIYGNTTPASRLQSSWPKVQRTPPVPDSITATGMHLALSQLCLRLRACYSKKKNINININTQRALAFPARKCAKAKILNPTNRAEEFSPGLISKYKLNTGNMTSQFEPERTVHSRYLQISAKS